MEWWQSALIITFIASINTRFYLFSKEWNSHGGERLWFIEFFWVFITVFTIFSAFKFFLKIEEFPTITFGSFFSIYLFRLSLCSFLSNFIYSAMEESYNRDCRENNHYAPYYNSYSIIFLVLNIIIIIVHYIFNVIYFSNFIIQKFS